jgi:putative transposase
MWQESAAEHPPCLPASPDDLIVLLAKRVERTLSSRGLELNGMFYNSDELMALRAELAANNVKVERFQVRYNPWDLGHAWVLNPLDNRYLKITAADAAMLGMTEYQWRVLRRAVRDKFDHPEHLMGLAASRNVIRDVVEAATKKPSRRRRARTARFLGTQPASSNIADSPPEDSPVTDDDFPVVTTDAPVLDECEDGQVRAAEESSEEGTQEDFSVDDLDVDDWGVASQ